MMEKCQLRDNTSVKGALCCCLYLMWDAQHKGRREIIQSRVPESRNGKKSRYEIYRYLGFTGLISKIKVSLHRLLYDSLCSGVGLLICIFTWVKLEPACKTLLQTNVWLCVKNVHPFPEDPVDFKVKIICRVSSHKRVIRHSKLPVVLLFFSTIFYHNNSHLSLTFQTNIALCGFALSPVEVMELSPQHWKRRKACESSIM